MSAPSRAALTTKGQKLSWLLERPDLWEGLPSATLPADRWDKDQLARLKALAKAARSAGLYSPKTYLRDVETSLLWIIHDHRVNRLQPEPLVASAQESHP